MCPLNVHMCACAVLRHHCKEKCKTYIQNVDIRYACVDILNCMFYILNVIFEFQDYGVPYRDTSLQGSSPYLRYGGTISTPPP
jgi:hypothetical protein